MNLSDDGDDFDSFFSGSKGTQKKPTPFNASKTRRPVDAMDDIFGNAEEGEKTVSQRIFKPPKISKESASFSVADNEDDDLGFDPKKPKSALKSQDLLNDLLTPIDTKRPQTSAGVKKPPMSRQSTDTTTETSNIFQNRPKTSVGRRSSGVINAVNTDPLGLFNKEKDKDSMTAASALSTPKHKQVNATADWLGLSTEPEIIISKTESPASPKLAKSSTTDFRNDVKITKNHEHFEKSGNISKDEVLTDEGRELARTSTTKPADTMAQNIILLDTLNKDAQQSFNALKYQEHHLILANQMKQQERALMEMQRKQETLLQKQESQFHSLLQQQLQRHQHLEEIITQQQHRLNNHLQLMMTNQTMNEAMPSLDLDLGHPTPSVQKTTDVEEDLHSAKTIQEKNSILNLIQIEADSKRLELENMRLEELVANTKSNYEKEIELLEKTHQKQMEVLEQQLCTMEQRLTKEVNNVENYYKQKLELLETENENLRRQHENQIIELKQDHEDSIRKLRQHQQEDVELIKEEHRRMLDAIRQAKMLEFAVLQENGSYLDSLKTASHNLTDLTGGLQELRADLRNKMDVIQLEREKKLDNREKHLEDAEKRIQITEETATADKKRLMELVATLETQLLKLSQDSAEENWQLRQKMATLEAEKSVFHREKDYFREQIQRDEQRVKDLKEGHLLEAQKLQFQMQEERSRLQVERAKFEMEKRLHSNEEHGKERLELEAAVQVTQDATRKADLERERYHKMQRQLEQLKRDLNDREHTLNIKEEELQQELLSYRMAERVAQEAQQKSKLAEQYYHNKLQLLQQKTHELAEKETHLSQERLLLSQDRIALHALKRKLSQETKCTLCKLTQTQQEISTALDGNLKASDSELLNTAPPVDNKPSFLNFDAKLSQQQNMDVVDRLLDAHIAESLRKMHSTTTLGGWETLLDDDHKNLVQQSNNLGTNAQYTTTLKK